VILQTTLRGPKPVVVGIALGRGVSLLLAPLCLRLHAALEGRYVIERKLGQGATRVQNAIDDPEGQCPDAWISVPSLPLR